MSIKDEVKSMYERGKEVEQSIQDGFYCENTKVLEVLLDHILFHWDDIMEVLIDDLLEEEALQLNKIEEMRNQGSQNDKQKQKSTKLADKSLYGKYHDYKSVDMRDIMNIFEEYR